MTDLRTRVSSETEIQGIKLCGSTFSEKEPVASSCLANHFDVAFFSLRPGISLEEAQQVADFLNENLLCFAITSFGDAQDTDRELRLSEAKANASHGRAYHDALR